TGVNVFPSQVEAVILEVPEVQSIYQIRVMKKGYLDVMAVEAEAKRSVYEDGEEKITALTKKISDRFTQVIGIKIPITILPFNSIPRSEGKAKRIIDERNN
ncbi:MAG: phenylacetate--CoA ligase, partial [Deltaproteobacteria bacterium]|nr:phenylacetate--CoA ligase [Deltaproteobacteria bacterium]